MCDVGYLCANFIFVCLSVLDLGPMYATDRRQTASSLNATAPRGHNKFLVPNGSEPKTFVM